MRGDKLLEIACFNPESALIAQKAGADRIELCADYSEGGITPGFSTISQVIQSVEIPVNVIIRPRGGNFVYSKKEIREMITAISFSRDHDANGLVFGALTADKKIDVKSCKELIDETGYASVTFHRAIDECINRDEAIEQLIDLGFDSILTSGGAKNAAEGIKTLRHLQEKYGKHIIIMPGGGIRSTNIQQLLQTGCHEFHSAAITGNSELADKEEIKKIKRFLNAEI